MLSFWAQVRVIAYRDFKAIVGQPVFLLFLLAPLFMVAMALLGGSGSRDFAEKASQSARIAVLTDAPMARYFKAADAQLRALHFGPSTPPRLVTIPTHGASDAHIARAMITAPGSSYEAVLFGPMERPKILAASKPLARYLTQVAEQAAQARSAGLRPGQGLVQADVEISDKSAGTARARQAMGYGAVVLIFLLTLLIAAQSISTFVEEKSNKIIEILASAASLEAIFLGKLVGMFGVAMLFIGFWGLLLTGGVQLVLAQLGATLPALNLAMTMPSFATLVLLYFTMSFFLFGAAFLGIGAQAPSARDIQLLSLPISVFQVSMFGLASSAASQPDSRLALFAQIFPFSSPMAMAARAASDGALWPHLLAILWQLLWVILIVRLSARLFRHGVLNANPGLFRFFRRKTA
ncbi:MAG: hypothetical protein RLZ59_1960 [Pseudomonadota bacterium]|jgi:ABC-2 type transport system permease protein